MPMRLFLSLVRPALSALAIHGHGGVTILHICRDSNTTSIAPAGAGIAPNHHRCSADLRKQGQQDELIRAKSSGAQQRPYLIPSNQLDRIRPVKILP